MKRLILLFVLSFKLVHASPQCVFYEFDDFGSYKTQYEDFFRTQFDLSLKKLQLQLLNRLKTSGNLTSPQQDLLLSIEKAFQERHLRHEAYQTHMKETQAAKFLLAREKLENLPPDPKLHQNVILGASHLVNSQKQQVNLADLFHLTTTDIKAISYAQALPELQSAVNRLLVLAQGQDQNKLFEAVKELDVSMDLLEKPLKADVLCTQNDPQKCEQNSFVSELFLQANQDILAKLIPYLQKNNQLASVHETIDEESAHTFFRSFGPFAEFSCNQDPRYRELNGNCDKQKEHFEKNKKYYEDGAFLKGYMQGIDELERVVPVFISRCKEWNKTASTNNRSAPYINIPSRCESDQSRSSTLLDMECVRLNRGVEQIFRDYKDSFIQRVRDCRGAGGRFYGGDGVINE